MKKFVIDFTVYEKQKNGSLKKVAPANGSFLPNITGDFALCGDFLKVFAREQDKPIVLCTGKLKGGVLDLSIGIDDNAAPDKSL